MRWTLERTEGAEGTLWRGECNDGTRLVDATLWTPNAARAIRDLNRLRDGTFWAHQSRRDDVGEPRYVPAA